MVILDIAVVLGSGIEEYEKRCYATQCKNAGLSVPNESICCIILCSTTPACAAILGEAGPDTIVEQTKEIPFGRGLSLEVPENPALGFLLEYADLGCDVIRCSCLRGLR
jgi:hypothetical protein